MGLLGGPEDWETEDGSGGLDREGKSCMGVTNNCVDITIAVTKCNATCEIRWMVSGVRTTGWEEPPVGKILYRYVRYVRTVQVT